MSRIIDWLFSKEDYESVRLSFWWVALVFGVMWICAGAIAVFVDTFPDVIQWYMELSFSDQMAFVFGYPGVIIIVLCLIVIMILEPSPYETYQKVDGK